MRLRRPAFLRENTDLPVAGLVGVIGPVIVSLGLHWDIAWHRDVGRDSFSSPPHLLVIAGLLLGLSAAFTVLTAGPTARLIDFHRDRPGMALALAGGMLSFVVLAFDNWWHEMLGVDLLAWSPAHLLLAVAFQLMFLGAVVDLTAGPDPPFSPAFLWGLFLGMTSLLMLDYEMGLPSYSMIWEPISMGLLFGLCLALASRTTPSPLAGTLACVVAVIFRLAANGLNAALGFTTPTFPLGLLFGGIAFDGCRRLVGLSARPALQRALIPLSLGSGWFVFVVSNGMWRRLSGSVPWEAAVILAAMPAGGAAALVAFRFGVFLAGYLSSADISRGRKAPARFPGWPTWAAYTVIPAGLIAVSGVPLVVDMGRGTQLATFSRAGNELKLEPESAGPGDSVSIVGVREGPISETVWLGALARRGSDFVGSIAPGQVDRILIWFQHENRAWTGVSRPSRQSVLELTTRNLGPNSTLRNRAVPAAYFMILILTGLASAALWVCLRSLHFPGSTRRPDAEPSGLTESTGQRLPAQFSAPASKRS